MSRVRHVPLGTTKLERVNRWLRDRPLFGIGGRIDHTFIDTHMADSILCFGAVEWFGRSREPYADSHSRMPLSLRMRCR